MAGSRRRKGRAPIRGGDTDRAACRRRRCLPGSQSDWQDHLVIEGAAALAARIRAGELSAREVVDTCLSAIDAVNGKLNAIVQLVPERARAEAAAADEWQAAGRDL